MSKYISGVILYDETIRQNAKDGTPLVKLITGTGAVPGIKVDAGAKSLPFCPGETVTEGLDGLRERLIEYRKLGAKFAKWRAVIDVGAGIPSYTCIKANAHALARYAALCQEQEIVPIVEPEVLMDGDHDIDRCFSATEWALKATFEELTTIALRSKASCSSPTWRFRARSLRRKPPSRKLPRRPCVCSRPACPVRSPVSPSSPAASRTKTQPRTSMR
jgi:fructose-bisphosphate aldolase class 1